MPRTKSAFTLIELLVVIAIIAILAAILFPVFAAAKDRATCVKCLSNERQLATAFLAYTSDNNGVMPKLRPRYTEAETVFDWCGAVYPTRCDPKQGTLWPYTKNLAIYLCGPDKRLPATNVDGNPTEYPLSYSANAEASAINVDVSSKRQSRLLLLIHESRDTINDGYLYWRNPKDDMPSKVTLQGLEPLLRGRSLFVPYLR